MKIERAESGRLASYFSLQSHHTCFIVQEEGAEYEYAFKIINPDEAIVYSIVDNYLEDVIDEFLFYSGFISKIKDRHGKVVYQTQPKERFKVSLESIQPSQLYVSEGKLKELKTWIKSEQDIVIPVTKLHGKFVSLDGHTRLKLAQLLGLKEVYVYLEEADLYIEDFVRFCQEQQKDSIFSLPVISVSEYEVLWNHFCENYFKQLTL